MKKIVEDRLKYLKEARFEYETDLVTATRGYNVKRQEKIDDILKHLANVKIQIDEITFILEVNEQPNH